MNEKGNAFEGIAGGRNYKRLAKIFGMGESFYRRAVGDLALPRAARVLDLGCGPGALSLALAEKAGMQTVITGIDISHDQLQYAESRKDHYSCKLMFQYMSMDELQFPDGHFDLVMTSMALHETPPPVRRAAIAETGRVLKAGGRFLLVDWSKPRFGIKALVWFPMVCFGENNKDNWNNAYAGLCAEQGMQLLEDHYLDSMSRRQLFGKGGPCDGAKN